MNNSIGPATQSSTKFENSLCTVYVVPLTSTESFLPNADIADLRLRIEPRQRTSERIGRAHVASVTASESS